MAKHQRNNQQPVDLKRLSNKEEMKVDFSKKLGVDPRLNALLNVAKNISEEKIAKKYGQPTTDAEKNYTMT